ncbi:MAG: hypothetical protein AB1941_16830 [Gemmatimonadota bacterium]
MNPHVDVRSPLMEKALGHLGAAVLELELGGVLALAIGNALLKFAGILAQHAPDAEDLATYRAAVERTPAGDAAEIPYAYLHSQQNRVLSHLGHARRRCVADGIPDATLRHALLAVAGVLICRAYGTAAAHRAERQYAQGLRIGRHRSPPSA